MNDNRDYNLQFHGKRDNFCYTRGQFLKKLISIQSFSIKISNLHHQHLFEPYLDWVQLYF